MGVPAHDEGFCFAQKYNLPIREASCKSGLSPDDCPHYRLIMATAFFDGCKQGQRKAIEILAKNRLRLVGV